MQSNSSHLDCRLMFPCAEMGRRDSATEAQQVLLFLHCAETRMAPALLLVSKIHAKSSICRARIKQGTAMAVCSKLMHDLPCAGKAQLWPWPARAQACASAAAAAPTACWAPPHCVTVHWGGGAP